MNNQELASLLIETANEILAEGANNKYVENVGKRYEKLIMKNSDNMMDELYNLNKLIKREKELVAQGKDPKELKKLEEKNSTVAKRYYEKIDPERQFTNNTIRKYSSNPKDFIYAGDPNDTSYINERKEAKERFNKDFASPKSSTNNARITERGKADEKRVAKEHGLRNKVNNESVALLLMEAAELLSE